jgi:hypothetical protein
MFRALALAALLLTACGDHAGSEGVSGSSPSPAGSLASAKPTPTATPVALPTAPTVAFPARLAFAVGTYDGFVYPQLVDGKPAGTPVRGCDGQVSSLSTLGRRVLVVCREPTYQLSIFDVDAGKISVIPGVQALEAVWTIQGDAVVYTTLGSCEPPAPICKTKLMQRELRTGTTTQLDEQYGVGSDLRLTGAGVTVWRAMNMSSFVRSADQTGTWVVREGALTRFSAHRLINGDKGRFLLETDGSPSTVSCCTSVILKFDQEQRITPSSIDHERAVALLEDGRIVAFRPDPDPVDVFEGSVVVYRAGVVERSGRGKFSAFRVVRDLDWIVGLEISGTGLTLHAYRVSDGAFASASGGAITITALAPLGPAKTPIP